MYYVKITLALKLLSAMYCSLFQRDFFSDVPTVQSWLSGGTTTVNVECKVAEHIVNIACNKLKEAVKRNFEEPEAHLNWFSK